MCGASTSSATEINTSSNTTMLAELVEAKYIEAKIFLL
ncbi:MAG: hypothetical protein RL154_814, partial [Pseudomonadota bacterium]